MNLSKRKTFRLGIGSQESNASSALLCTSMQTVLVSGDREWRSTGRWRWRLKSRSGIEVSKWGTAEWNLDKETRDQRFGIQTIQTTEFSADWKDAKCGNGERQQSRQKRWWGGVAWRNSKCWESAEKWKNLCGICKEAAILNRSLMDWLQISDMPTSETLSPLNHRSPYEKNGRDVASELEQLQTYYNTVHVHCNGDANHVCANVRL